MQDLNGSRFFSADRCHVPAEAWCGSSNTGIGKTIRSVMMSLNVQSPLAIRQKGGKKEVYGKAETIRNHTDGIKRTFV